MTEKQAIRKSINHWKRMIKWVEKQDVTFKKLTPRMLDMSIKINESWCGDDCALCELYQPFCEECPLASEYGFCSSPDDRNAWKKTALAVTWRGWLYHAKRLLKQLESLTKTNGK